MPLPGFEPETNNLEGCCDIHFTTKAFYKKEQ